jgi:hypothetical protein
MQIRKQRGLKKLYILLIVFVAPVIVSSILYNFHGYFNLKTTNHGVLLKQVVDAEYLYSWMPENNLKKWRVIFVDNGSCDDDCKKVDYQLHQMQKALGEKAERVQVLQLDGRSAPLARLQQALSLEEKQDFAVNNKIYLVDPAGNLFMYYPATTNPMNVLKDMKKVLEVSQIG